MSFVNYDETPPTSPNRGPQNVEYVRIDLGQSALLRPIGAPFEYYKHWRPISAISPGRDTDVCWQSGHAPQRRFALRCLDRRTGRPAVWCIPEHIYWRLCAWAQEHRADPGGKQGVDWLVTCRGTGDRTEWQVDPQSYRAYTDAEKIMLKAWYDQTKLELLFAPDTPERIAALYRESCEHPEGPIPGSKKWQETR